MSIKSPILITGCARSGTSMTAGVVHYCGAWGGKLAGPTKNNKKGMFENNEIRESVIKPILRKYGFDPMGQNPLLDISVFENNTEDLREKVLSILRNQGLKDNMIWFYKGAKMCLMWSLWHKAFPNAKWIIVRRDDSEIVNSCMKTGFMSKYHDDGGWRKWIEVHKKRFREMEKAGLKIIEVYPKDMIGGDFVNMKKVINGCGLEWNSEKVLSFITPALWSNIKRNIKEECNAT